MPRSIVCRPSAPVLAALVLAALVVSCGTPQPPAEAPPTTAAPSEETPPPSTPEPTEPPTTAPAPAEPQETAAAPMAEPAPAPPPTGGDVIVGPNGWSLGGTALTSDTTNTTVIPAGFTGGLGEISFVAGLGQPAESVSSVTITFASGATMQISTGASGNWQCKASGQTSFASCTTHDASTIGSDWAPAGATITIAGRSTSMVAGTSITFK